MVRDDVLRSGCDKMVGCHDMKTGQLYHCRKCGLELRVVKICSECEDDCGCKNNCDINCCGEPLLLKEH